MGYGPRGGVLAGVSSASKVYREGQVYRTGHSLRARCIGQVTALGPGVLVTGKCLARYGQRVENGRSMGYGHTQALGCKQKCGYGLEYGMVIGVLGTAWGVEYRPVGGVCKRVWWHERDVDIGKSVAMGQSVDV